jgi:Calcineurin-like phosphoesterase
MLLRVRVLQIGDVHLPSAMKSGRKIDQKDASFSVELRNLISSLPIKVVFREIYKIIDDGGVDGIIFMGDFTDQGDLSGYEKTCQFIAQSLQLGDGRRHSKIPVGIVPGNHDINRPLALDPGITTKFDPLNAALRKAALPALPVQHNIVLPITSGSASTSINLMNSCWGCGAREYIPEYFRARIGKAIEETLQKGGKRALKTYYDRQFDTPAFSEPSIQQLVQAARSLEASTLFVVVAHHNLLPQRQPRIAQYTELVNSGAIRASLCELDRPVVYLHGHIHVDPVETVTIPNTPPLICISAPAAEDGFNVLDFVFTRSGLPLSCQITPWRFDGSGILHAGEKIVVPLLGKRRRSHDPTLNKIYSFMLDRRELYWNELVGITPPFFSTEVEEQTREAIELLIADESILVENYDSAPNAWIIRANI